MVQIVTVMCVLGSSEAAPWPGARWPVSTPQAQGFDSAALTALGSDIAAGQYGRVDGLLIIRHGTVVYDRSFPRNYPASHEPPGPFNYHDPNWHPFHDGLHTLQSITKGITGTLVGIAIGRGELPTVEVEVKRYFDNPKPAEGVTLEDLLTMRSGIRWDEESAYTDPHNDWAALERQRDWIGYILDKPMASKPGTKFVYSSGDAVLLGHVLQAASGMSVESYAEKYLFHPLGIKKFVWKSVEGTTDTQGGLYLDPHDLARIGYLYLRDGMWNGQRIVPKGWVEASMVPRKMADDDDWRYGYYWWLIPYEGGHQRYAWTLLGYGGQRLVVIPEYDLIVVTTAWNIGGNPPRPMANIVERVLTALHRERPRQDSSTSPTSP